MAVNIKSSFDCSQREVVVDIANIIYRSQGYDISGKPLDYLFKSQHPQEQAVLTAAEAIYELLAGDSPDYDDEDE